MREHAKQQVVQAIGIFIINTKGELLLHKKTEQLMPLHYLWEIPYLVHYDKTLSHLDIAAHYLLQLGLTCQLHEAFTLSRGGHVIIAFASQADSVLHFATDVYKWMPLDDVVHGSHEQPSRYAPWLKAALEGVVLYVKNFLKNQSSQDSLQSQSETL